MLEAWTLRSRSVLFCKLFRQVLNRSFSSNNIAATSGSKDRIDTASYLPESIRNFSIIAHIDHGKSTLADRLLEVTRTISPGGYKANQQILDKLKVERERGITVKAQTASMLYDYNDRKYLLNLIDTPGHVDFAWEVSRSLAACEGAILLVDASQGVQAQTLSVFHVARERGLKIIPILNKIDLPASNPERCIAQMRSTFGIKPEEVLSISAKTGVGVEQVLHTIIAKVPPPVGAIEAATKALLFDSTYDRYRGVISLIRVLDGSIRNGDKIASCHTKKKYEVTDIGLMHPEEEPTDQLQVGQVGYLACNMKESDEAHVGDTLHKIGEKVEPVEGFLLMKPMVFAGVYPVDANDYLKLEESIKRLTLTDRSVTVQSESSTALSQGLRLGFLGTLHMDVFRQRLEDEYEASVIITAPTVPYKVIRPNRTEFVSNPTEFPDPGDSNIKNITIEEPIVKATIIVPQDYIGEMMSLCSLHRGEDLDYHYLDEDFNSSRVMLTCKLPLSEIVSDFYGQLKSQSSGFASFDYEDAGYKRAELSKMTFLLNSRPVDALAIIVHKSSQDQVARAWVKKLHKVIPRQQFEVPIQATLGKKVLARETLAPFRKDVTAGMYGGHHERKLKKLAEQKEGKKKLKRIGQVDLPQEAFFDLLGSRAEKK